MDAARPPVPAPGAGDDLRAAAASRSPHLDRLLKREGAWLDGAWDDPGAALRAVAAEARGARGRDAGTLLRRAKDRTSLLVALCDLGGRWPLERVTEALTALADAALSAALAVACEAEARRGVLPADPAEAGLFALAMGKMGAGELNYSSDVDLVLLFDRARYGGRYGDARAGMIRAARAAMRLLSEVTAEGYVFRTDLRLRPDPSTTPLILPTDAAERYYESLGRAWERAAHVKARAAAGDVPGGEGYLGRLRPFVWRRHLDFAAIREAADMLGAIRAANGVEGGVRGRDVKCARGGIREVEFAAQSLQLVHGGRDPSLRVRGTVEALGRLAAAGHLSAADAGDLAADYRFLRTVEHRLQMVRDAQTHRVPDDPEELARAAGLAGHEGPALWLEEIGDRMARVARIAGKVLGPPEGAPRVPPARAEALSRWKAAPALRSAAARAGLDRIAGALLARVDAAPRPDAAMAVLGDFIARLPAGAQLFALMEANPSLMDLLVDIAGTAPALARHLAGNAGVLDAVIGGEAFAPWPGTDALAERLSAAAAREPDHEARLIALRRNVAEWRFAVGLHLLRGLAGPEEVGRRYAELAEGTLRAALPLALADVARRHGAVPGASTLVLGMGSLGAGRLDALSDLDLIVVYDAPDGAVSDGRRPLPAAAWHAKAAQALVTTLSAPMAGGVLYEVDLRLRPSGRRGPVAVSRAAFEHYQRHDAWAWEHLALTRARPVAGDPALGAAVEGFRAALVAARAGGPARIAAGVAEMRARLAAARPGGATWDLKDGPGGLRDVELAAQAATWIAGAPDTGGAAQVAHWGEGAAVLEDARALAADVRLALSLLAPEGVPPGAPIGEALGEGGLAVLSRIAGHPAGALPALLARRRAAAAAAIDARLAEWGAGDS